MGDTDKSIKNISTLINIILTISTIEGIILAMYNQGKCWNKRDLKSNVKYREVTHYNAL
jgi:hypothetical protein